MAKRKSKKSKNQTNAGTPGPLIIEVAPKPLRIAQVLCSVILIIGTVMLVLGAGVLFGIIKEGWGFPMSAVPNWGGPWGLVLIAAAAAYIVGPVWLFIGPERGSIMMIIVSALSVLVGTPLITTTTEIFYNLFQETKSRPDWIDSVWGYFMFLHIATVIALCRAYPVPDDTTKTADAR